MEEFIKKTFIVLIENCNNFRQKIMKNLFTLIFLISFFNYQSLAQCDEYYVNELIAGNDDNCPVPDGSPVRFCPSLNGIAVNGVTFNVMKWDGISTQYLTLTKNGGIAGTMVLKLKEKELKINFHGCGGSVTYSISFNEREYKIAAERKRKEAERRLAAEKLRIERLDNELHQELLTLLENQKIDDALNAYNRMSRSKRNELQSKISKPFQTYYESKPVILSTTEIKKIIEDNIQVFSNFNVGTYNVEIGIDGQTKGLSTNVSIEPYVYKKGGFECKRPCEFLIDIKEVSDYQLSVNSYYESGKISDESSALADMVGTKNYYWFIADDKKGERVIVRSYKDYPKSKYTNYTQIENILYNGACSSVIEVKLVTIKKTTANGMILKEDRNVSDCIKSKS